MFLSEFSKVATTVFMNSTCTVLGPLTGLAWSRCVEEVVSLRVRVVYTSPQCHAGEDRHLSLLIQSTDLPVLGIC